MRDMADLNFNPSASGAAGTLENLAQWGADELLALLVASEDRAPRAAIEECACRGITMVERLTALVERKEFWDEDSSGGTWWMRLHVAMILGLIPDEGAGRLLVHLMERLERAGDDDAQDWLAGYWPSLMRNKPAACDPLLLELAMRRECDWYMRIQAIETLTARAAWRDPGALETTLDWAAKVAEDDTEDLMLRLPIGSLLLDFPRPRHQKLIEALFEKQDSWTLQFSLEDIERAYLRRADRPEWRSFDDPWAFYSLEQVAEREQRRQEEHSMDADRTLVHNHGWQTYVRDAPKTGRNDPCPCGSGKKYKKCCLVKEEG